MAMGYGTNAMVGGMQGAGYLHPNEAAVESERTFDALVGRLNRCNGTLAEAIGRLEGFANRLHGPEPTPIGEDRISKKPEPLTNSIEGRLADQADSFGRQADILHALISRLERSA